jgi:hypothetical protein
MRRITALLASSVLLVAACGGDDDDSAGGVQDEAADALIEDANDAGADPDEDCIREKTADLDDDDAQKIVDADDDATAELSPEGMTILADAATCLSAEAVLDSIIEALPEGVDGDCVRDRLADLDASTAAEEVQSAIVECGTG